MIIVGNKSDLRNRRQVSTEDAVAYSKDKNLAFVETSALDSTGVDESFIQILTQIYEQNRVKDVDNSNEGGSKSKNKDGKGISYAFSQLFFLLVHLFNNSFRCSWKRKINCIEIVRW